VSHFKNAKQTVISIASGDGQTAALVETADNKQHFVIGKFMPLEKENSYKTLAWFENMAPVESFMIRNK